MTYLHHTVVVAVNPSHVVASASADVDALVALAELVHVNSTATGPVLPRTRRPVTLTTTLAGATIPVSDRKNVKATVGDAAPLPSRNAARAVLFTPHETVIASSVSVASRELEDGNRIHGDSRNDSGSPRSLTMSGAPPVSKTGVTSPCKNSGVSVTVGDIVYVAETVAVVVTDRDTDAVVVADGDVDADTDVVTVVDADALSDTEGDGVTEGAADGDTVRDVVSDTDAVSVTVYDDDGDGDTEGLLLREKLSGETDGVPLTVAVTDADADTDALVDAVLDAVGDAVELTDTVTETDVVTLADGDVDADADADGDVDTLVDALSERDGDTVSDTVPDDDRDSVPVTVSVGVLDAVYVRVRDVVTDTEAL